MMARYNLPSSFEIMWKHHEERYVEVFSRALAKLALQNSIKGDEDTLSESLCPKIAEICLEMERAGYGEIRHPIWEAPKQPVTEKELNKGSQKRPDFTCSFHDSHASTPDEHEIPFHVECKLLGEPTSSSWVLCKNYVTNGIVRFDNRTHAYGKRARSGVMIGYIISMTPQAVQAEVNRYKDTKMKHVPDIAFHWKRKTFVWKTRSEFARKQVNPSQFCLTHIWADIRKNYQQ
jgi:hypothetical protein